MKYSYVLVAVLILYVIFKASIAALEKTFFLVDIAVSIHIYS